MNNIYYLIVLCFIEIIGDFSLEYYVQSKSNIYLIIGLLSYAGVVFLLIQSLKTANILYVNAMWDGISALIETLAAFFILGQRFQNMHQYIGVFLLISGIFFVKYNNKDIDNTK